MYSDTNNFSCIYKIVNKINNNIYVGSCFKVKPRRNNHFKTLSNNKHPNRYLQRAYNKYGKENFIFEIIERLEFPIDYDKILIKEHLENREQYYINSLNPKYNIRRIAESNLGIKFSDEVRKKFSENQRGDKNGFYGKKHSIETLELFKNRENKNYKYILKASQDRRKFTDEDIIKLFDLFQSGFTKKNLIYIGLLTDTQYKNILWNKERYKKLKGDYNLTLDRTHYV